MITTIILTKNHEDIIVSTIENAKELGSVLIADLGSTDKTIDICEKEGCKVFQMPFKHDYSAIRNTLITKATTEWIFYLEPGEEVISGAEYFKVHKVDPMYRTMVLRDDLLLKQTRLFRKEAKFTKRVFETIDPDVSEQTLPIVISGNTKMDIKDVRDCLTLWKKDDPLSPDPEYYLASLELMIGDYNKFISIADHFLFQKKITDSSVAMTKYYIATLLKSKNINKALKFAMECIVAYPLMAEFWCLLGDLYLLSLKEYDRAYHFYDNAIILGSQRLQEDTMPMEISKYDEYPKKMMQLIRHAIQITLSGSSNEDIKT